MVSPGRNTPRSVKRNPSNVSPADACTPPTSKFSYYSDDLIAVEEIIEDLAYPSSVMLLTGVLLNVLHRKNGDDVAASLDDVREFVSPTDFWRAR